MNSHLANVILGGAALLTGASLRELWKADWFQEFLAWLFFMTVLFSLTPALTTTAVLMILFFVLAQKIAAIVLLALFCAGLSCRITNGYGIGI